MPEHLARYSAAAVADTGLFLAEHPRAGSAVGTVVVHPTAVETGWTVPADTHLAVGSQDSEVSLAAAVAVAGYSMAEQAVVHSYSSVAGFEAAHTGSACLVALGNYFVEVRHFEGSSSWEHCWVD